jgi:hypothetical protein
VPAGGDIQGALDALTGGGVIMLQPGTYTLTTPLTMRYANTVLRGSGKGVTRIVYTANPNLDIITQLGASCTIEDLGIYGASSPSNGAAVPGTGRGVMLAIPDGGGSVQNRRPTFRRIEIVCTPSWCIFDPGIQTFNGQSNGACPGNLWTATLAGGASPLGSSGFALSINLHIEDCDFSFWGSNGAVFSGSACVWQTLKRVKTAGYTFNTFTAIADPISTLKHDMGGIFLFNALGSTIDDCYFQSAGDGVILPDKDAVMFSTLNGNNIYVKNCKWEVLGGNTGCADSNGGAGGREFYFITSVGTSAATVSECIFVSNTDDSLFGNASLTNWGTKIFRGEGAAWSFRDCMVTHTRSRRSTYSGALTTSDPTYFDYNDFMFLGSEGSSSSMPITIDNFSIVNHLGGVREPVFPYPVADVANCTTTGTTVNLTTTTGDFSHVNRGDVVSGTGVTAGTRVQYVRSTTAITLDQVATVPGGTTISFDPPSTSAIHRPNFRYKDRRWEKIGRFSSCGAPTSQAVNNCSGVPYPGTTVTTTGDFIAARIRPGMRLTDASGTTNIRANTQVSQVVDATTLTVDQPLNNVAGFGPETITFEASENDLEARYDALHEGSNSAVFGFVQSGDLDDGMWVRNISDKQFRQLPYYRRRPSFFANPMQGDLNYLTSDESLYTYNYTAAAWQSYVKDTIEGRTALASHVVVDSTGGVVTTGSSIVIT